MGCGGSKDAVAAGNTVSINRLLRRKSSTIMSISSPSIADRQISSDTGSGSKVEKEQEGTECADAAGNADGKSTATVKTVEEEKVTPPELSSQSSSSDKEEQIIEIKDAGDGGAAAAAAKEGVGVNCEEKSEALVVEEKGTNFKDIEDDGESIGKNSVDFKEAISIEELESEATVSVKETSKESEIPSGSLAH
ncbi:uncharacterized protein [Typha angustifolia]|uniref:uncharacterized protein n=1 Tax=Typha angustifolia TaxID=59011 RepID=UPI003C2F4BC9